MNKNKQLELINNECPAYAGKTTKRDDMYRLCTSSKGELIKIFNLLYIDSNFYLKRKFEKFNYYVNTEVSQIITDHRNAQRVNVKRVINLHECETS